MGSFCKPKVSYTNDGSGSGNTSGSSGAQMATNMAASDGSQQNYENLNAFVLPSWKRRKMNLLQLKLDTRWH